MQGKLGSILISLCYAPTAGRITIAVLKCQNLAAKDITGKSGEKSLNIETMINASVAPLPTGRILGRCGTRICYRPRGEKYSPLCRSD